MSTNESYTGIVAGIVVGCVAALFILSVVVGFIRHRRNRNVRESVGSSSRDTTSFGWLLGSTRRKLFQGPRFGSADEVVALTTYSPPGPFRSTNRKFVHTVITSTANRAVRQGACANARRVFGPPTDLRLHGIEWISLR